MTILEQIESGRNNHFLLFFVWNEIRKGKSVKKQSLNDSASQWTSLMTVSTHRPHRENASLLTSPKRFQMTLPS
jgi:hypothetical protein